MLSSTLQNNLDIRLVLEDGEKVDRGIVKWTVKAWQNIHSKLFLVMCLLNYFGAF